MHVKGSEIQEEDSVTEQLETHVRDVEEDDRNDPSCSEPRGWSAWTLNMCPGSREPAQWSAAST